MQKKNRTKKPKKQNPKTGKPNKFSEKIGSINETKKKFDFCFSYGLTSLKIRLTAG